MDEVELMKLATSVARHNLALVLDNPEQFVEDAAQEAVLAMWLVQHDAKTRQYLRNAGRWAVVNFIKSQILEYKTKNNFLPPYPVELDADGGELIASVDDDDEEQIELSNLQDALRLALQIGQKQTRGARAEESLSRMVDITILLLNHAPAAVIADTVGVPVSQIKKYIARTRKRIEQYLSYRERFVIRCLKCGADSHLTVHHIVPYRAGGLGGADNEAVLCRYCHAALENYIQRNEWRGMPAEEHKIIFKDWLSSHQS